jgi:catechol 2,3-dioxygenase-like lactoylglutathione lyase family enzyme
MKHVISNLLKLYEDGVFTRRQLIEGLATLTVASGTASAAGSPYEYSNLNHVSICASDVERSAAFYQKVFGLSERRVGGGSDKTIFLKVNDKSHLSIHRRNPAGVMDHFSFGVDGFNEASVIEDLKQRGATASIDKEAGLHVKDPDGLSVQIIANNVFETRMKG